MLVAVERETRFVLLEPMKTLTASEVCDFLFSRLYCVFGIPTVLFSDNGAAFRSQLVKLLNDRLGVSTEHCLPYSSASNGMCENMLVWFHQL